MIGLVTAMNQLPKVLQNEIWEYVRGDRAYWKQQFTQTIIKVVPYINQNLRRQIQRCRDDTATFASVRFKNMLIVFDVWDEPKGCEVLGWRFDRLIICTEGLKFEEAVKLFYEKVEIEAIRGPTTK